MRIYGFTDLRIYGKSVNPHDAMESILNKTIRKKERESAEYDLVLKKACEKSRRAVVDNL